MRWRTYLMIAIFGLLAPGFIGLANGAQTGGPSPDNTEANIAEVSHQVDAFARDLERVRRFMGAPLASPLDIGIRSHLPRDLYFQTLTLWKKTDRLLFEINRMHGSPPTLSSDGIDIQNILGGLRDAHQMLQRVMQELQIADSEIAPPSGTQISSTELFDRVLALNRQLNLLLERHISPSDVYQELSLAIGYSARLLARYPDATRIPAEPPFEPDKQPKDVYLKLIECLQTITRIFNSLELAILNIDFGQTDLDRLQPSDVYLLASMIVSQLDFLYQHTGMTKPPPQPVYPGLKFPAHSYQRAGILQIQLQQLERLLATDHAVPAPPDRPE